MGTVNVTEFRLPNGTKAPHTFTLPDEISNMAKDMVLTCEVLRNDDVVFYASYPEDEKYDYEELEIVPPPSNKEEQVAALIRVIQVRYNKGRDYDPTQEEGGEEDYTEQDLAQKNYEDEYHKNEEEEPEDV